MSKSMSAVAATLIVVFGACEDQGPQIPMVAVTLQNLMTLDPDTGNYVGTIPGLFIMAEWDLMYFVEALAKNGDGRMAPDMEQEMPYVIVPVRY